MAYALVAQCGFSTSISLYRRVVMTNGSKPPQTKETSTKDSGKGQGPKQSGAK